MTSDVKDPDGATDVVAQTVEAVGRVDILVNNAQQFHQSKPLNWTVSHKSGVFATWRYMVAAYWQLKAHQGAVINRRRRHQTPHLYPRT